MAITYNDEHEVFVNGERIMWPRDGNHSPSAVLAGFDVNDVLTFGRFTTDGKLKVDASVSVDHIEIGDVLIQARDSLGGLQDLQCITDPVTSRFALITQDPRFTFTSGNLNVNASIVVPPGLALDATLKDEILATMGFYQPVDTVITRDPNGDVAQIVETMGAKTKTTVITRAPCGSVSDINEFIT